MEIDLGRVLDALPAMVWTALPDGHIDFVNRRWSEYTGLSLDEAHGWDWQAAVNPDDLPKLLERWRSILASGEPGELEARVRRFDGHYRLYLVQCNPMFNDAGRIVKWCGTATDVDDFRRAEATLRRRELDFQLVVDSIPIPVAVTTPSGEVEGLNQLTLDYFGKTLEELKSWKASEVVHPDDLERTVTAQLEAHQQGHSYNVESRHRRADGVYRWYNVIGLPLRDPQGNILRWFHLLIDIDDRKRAEEALRKSEQNSRLIVDSIPGMVAVHMPGGEQELVNRQLLEYFGTPEGELKSWATSDAVHPEDLPLAVEVFTRSMASGEPFELEVRGRRFDGAYRWLQSRGSPLKDTNGRIVRWYNLLVDVDERRRAEEALGARERNLKLIIDTIPVQAWSARPDGTAEFFNQHYLDYMGLSAEQAQGWGWTAAVHPEDLNGLAATWQAIMASEKLGETEARLRRHDGEYRWFLFRANPLHDESGNVVKWYGVNTDIEDRKRAEVELRRAYDSFADAQRLSKTGSFITDLLADDHNWSEEAFRIFEFDPATKVTVQRIRETVHPEDLPSFDSVIERGSTGIDVNFEFRIVTSRGAVKHVRGLAHVIEQVAGRPMFVGALQDVTETKVAEGALNNARSELAHVARVTTLSVLTASIAHEVNQPLSGIITNAGTCLRMLAADPPKIDIAQETARRTIRDGNRAADVIARLRALFTKRAGTIEAVDLNDAVREVIALSSTDLQRGRVVLRTELADELPSVGGDRIQLQQVVMNLLRNAADATSKIDDRPRRVVIRTDSDSDSQVRLSVEDNGVGFGPDGTERLFETFYTTKSDGMGIGLSVSRSIIESHRGRLWAVSNDGPGATFSFSIPEYSGEEIPVREASALHAPVASNAQSSAGI